MGSMGNELSLNPMRGGNNYLRQNQEKAPSARKHQHPMIHLYNLTNLLDVRSGINVLPEILLNIIRGST